MPDAESQHTGPGPGRLEELLKPLGRLAVAFSGGVDSTLLLAAATRALGPDNTLALTVDSMVVPRAELDSARTAAAGLGVRHLMVRAEPMDDPEFAANPPRRCYICKKMLLGALWDRARELGFETLAVGDNMDDADDYRPGAEAVAELGALTPLKDAGLDKTAVRRISRELGLAAWDRPSMACLASRFPHDHAITAEALARVEAAEEFLRSRGLGQVRVRAHGPMARIETDEPGMELFNEPGFRRTAAAELQRLGFRYSALDLAGYRTGAMNPFTEPGSA